MTESSNVPQPRPRRVTIIHDRGAAHGRNFPILDHLATRTRRVPERHQRNKSLIRLFASAIADPKYMEQLRRLRDTVLVAAARTSGTNATEKNGHTVAFVGVRGNEGTSTLTLLLSLCLAESSLRHVALMDVPQEGERMKLLADFLGLSKETVHLETGQRTLVGYCNEGFPNFQILRSLGREDQVPFQERRFRPVLEQLREQFDVTILGLPPLLQHAGSVLAVPSVDQIYLVAEAKKTPLFEIERCAERVKAAGGQLAGVVLNKQTLPVWSRFLWRDYFY